MGLWSGEEISVGLMLRVCSCWPAPHAKGGNAEAARYVLVCVYAVCLRVSSVLCRTAERGPWRREGQDRPWPWFVWRRRERAAGWYTTARVRAYSPAFVCR